MPDFFLPKAVPLPEMSPPFMKRRRALLFFFSRME